MSEPSGDRMQYERFGAYYDLIYAWRSYGKDCDLLEELFRRYAENRPKRLLDVGCGTGSHAVILAQRGYSVVGMDRSPTMIEQARGKAQLKDVDASFVVADVRNFHLHQTFDAAFSFFATFSYLTTDQELRGSLKCIRRHLTSGGLLVFDAWCATGGGERTGQGHRIVEAGGRRAVVLTETHSDRATSLVTLRIHCLIIQEGRIIDEFSETHQLRAFHPQEVKTQLESSGFRPEEIQLYDRDRNMRVVARAV